MARTPFYGRGPGPQIARMDMQAATAPGRAWGDAFEAVGREGAEAIETFSKNKQKSEMLDGQIGTILENMTPEKQKEMESSPLKPQFDKFLKGELTLTKKESFVGSLLLDRQMDKEQEQTDRQDFLWNRQKELAEAQDESNRFLFAKGGPTPLDPDPFAPVSDRLFSPAPFEKFLQTEAGQEAAKGISESGMSDQAKMLAFQSIMARETAQTPKGGFTDDIVGPDGQVYTYRFNNDGSVRALVGKTPAQPKSYPSPEEKAREQELLADSEANTDFLKVMDTGLRQALDSRNSARAALSTLRSFSKDQTTGGFSRLKTDFVKALNSLGFEFDEETLKDTAKFENFTQQAGKFLFASIQQTKGSISNAEMTIFMNINPSEKNTILGNTLMLEFVIAAGERAERKLAYKQELEGQNLIARDRVRLLDKFDKLPKNQITHIIDPIVGDGSQPAGPPSATRRGAKQVPEDGGVIKTSSGGLIKRMP